MILLAIIIITFCVSSFNQVILNPQKRGFGCPHNHQSSFEAAQSKRVPGPQLISSRQERTTAQRLRRTRGGRNAKWRLLGIDQNAFCRTISCTLPPGCTLPVCLLTFLFVWGWWDGLPGSTLLLSVHRHHNHFLSRRGHPLKTTMHPKGAGPRISPRSGCWMVSLVGNGYIISCVRSVQDADGMGSGLKTWSGLRQFWWWLAEIWLYYLHNTDHRP